MAGIGWRRVYASREPGKKGDRWILRWQRTDGRMGKKSLGNLSACGRDLNVVLERLRAEFEVELNRYGDPQEREQEQLKNEWAWAEFVEAYLATRKNEISVKHYASMRDVLGAFGRFAKVKTVQDVTTDHLVRYRAKRLKDGVTKPTANRDIRVLHRAFRYAHQVAQRISFNPVAGIEAIKTEIQEPETLTPEQVRKLLDNAPNVEWRAFLACMAMCGLRLGEAHRLRRRDVITKSGAPTALKVVNTKGKRPRVIPVPKPLAADLAAIRVQHATIDPEQPCFPGISAQSVPVISRKCGELFADLELSGSAQTLRRTFGSQLAQHGVSIYKLKMLMGHSSIQVTERYYLHIPDSILDDVAMPTYPEREKEAGTGGKGGLCTV